MENILIQKFKTIFYYFNCYSQFDKSKNCFSDIYELDGIKWNLGEMWESTRLGVIIPYEGELPIELRDKLSKEDRQFELGYNEDSKKVYTDLKSFFKFIVAHHNHCNGTNFKFEDVYEYYLDKFFYYNSMSRDTTITDLANAANEYYRDHYNSSIDEMDLAINEIVQSIDEHHSNVDPGKIRDYGYCESDMNDDTRTSYFEHKLISGCLNSFSIKRGYLMIQESLMDEIDNLCNQFSLKPKKSNFTFRVMHNCLARFGSVYDEEDYNTNKANSLEITLDFFNSVTGDGFDGTQFLSYNLSTHELNISELGSNEDVNRVATLEDKKAIYEFLCKVKEKIDIDLKEKTNQKVLMKK